MQFEARLQYTAPLTRKAVFAYWKRCVGVVLPVVILILLADFVFLVVQGDRSWIVGLFGTVISLSVAFLCALYAIHYRNGLQKLREVGPNGAMLLAEESSFTLQSAIGHSTFKWTAISSIWRYSDFWLVLFSKAQFVTIPLQNVRPEMQEFVLGRVRDSGGEVR